MLTYLIQTSERLILLTLCLSLAYAYKNKIWKKNDHENEHTLTIAIGIGIVLALIMTYFKTHTALVDTSLWNLRNHVLSIILFVVFIVSSVLENNNISKKKIGTKVSLGLIIALFMLYYLPYVMEMPHIILRTEESIVSTNFIVRMTGVCIGVLLCIILGVSSYKGLMALDDNKFKVVFNSVLGVNMIKYVGLIVGTLLTRRMVKSNHILFTISKYTSNYIEWFIYIVIIIFIGIQVKIIIDSYTQKELYRNPAERRKIVSKWRKRRKSSRNTIVCGVVFVLILTIIKAYDSREVELSPIEETKQDDSNMYVSFDQVSDGMLHRYGYTAEDGTIIRFIIIQKPNSTAYGIGLDACEICGETGYYQRGDMVVCNLCDVVMNINTIGFKGGCNPIPIDYNIADGNIIVPIEGLLEHIDEFK